MPKILIAESLDEPTLKRMAADKADFEFDYQPEIIPEYIESILHGYDALIVRPKEVTGKAIESAPNLKLIVRGGAGLNSIDLVTAEKCGVQVKNTPGENSISTAEFAFEMIMNLAGRRNMSRAASDVREDEARSPEEYQGRELAGQKLAIIGLGNIGLALAKRAVAFDMEVIYHSRSKKDVAYEYCETLAELLGEGADIISLHVPLAPETVGFIGEDEFEMMKRGTVLINCARPQLVQPEAFAQALGDGVLQSAGIDGDMDLIETFVKQDPHNKCIITHHIADATLQAQQKITRAVMRHVFELFEGGSL